MSEPVQKEREQIDTGFLEIRKRGKAFRVAKGLHDEFWSSVANNRWENHTFAIFDRFIDKDRSYIDIGAWIGPTVLYGSGLARKVWAIEPDPVAFSELEANLRLNQPVTNVRLFNICIAPKSGKIAFGNLSEAGNSQSSILFGSGSVSWTVDGVTLEELVTGNRITDCNFIKMDIEGGEYLVIPAMSNYLCQHRPTLYLSLHSDFLLPRAQHPKIFRRIRKFVTHFRATLKIVWALRCYRRFYDQEGNAIGKWRLLFKRRDSIVVSDLDW